jgi:hypothetical protein
MTDALTTIQEPSDLTQFGDIEGVEQRPQAIDPSDRSGKEGIRREDIQLPRLTVAQGLHPQLVPGEPNYIKGLTIGEMFNDLTNEIYGSGPLTVVPIYRSVTRIEFDKEDKKVVLDRDVPPGDARLKWSRGTGKDGEDEPPAATEFVEVVSLLLRAGKEPERLVVSIKTTNKQMREAAKKWTTYIDARSGPIYSGLYKITSQMIKGKTKKGQDTLYGVFVVKNAGFIPADTPAGAALLAYTKRFHEASKGKPIVVARDGVVEAEIDDSMAANPEGPTTEM